MNARRVGPCLLFLMAFEGFCGSASAAEDSPTAVVVFFTPGGHWRGMGERINPFLKKAKVASSGSVFDGEAPVATLTHSRYLALKVLSGPHTFSASRLGGHPNPKESVSVDLRPNETAYFAITATAPSAVGGYAVFETSHVTAVTCEQFLTAQKEDRYDPVAIGEVDKKYRRQVTDESDLSVCKR